MKQITTTADIKRLGRILGVWAHPDDETMTSAGIMIAASDNGQAAACITATRGEAGVKDESRWPKEKLGQIRENELKNALNIIGQGKIEHHQLDYKDGDCQKAKKQAIDKVQKIIESFGPDTILTFGPDGLTGHPDHKSVSKWTELAVQRIGKQINVFHVYESRERYNSVTKQMDAKFDIYFNIDNPPLCDESDMDICFRLDNRQKVKKLAALRAQASQFTDLFEQTEPEKIEALVACECFKRT